MDAKQFLINKRYLADKSAEYPFSCQTKLGYPRPDIVSHNLQLDFIRVPLMNEAVWCFRTASDMSLFKGRYVTLDNKS